MSALSVSIARSASASSFQSSSLGSAEVQTCFVCCNDIIERTDLGEGDDAIFCEGSHQQWAHAQCVGVNAALYQALSTSGDTWQCPTCATTTALAPTEPSPAIPGGVIAPGVKIPRVGVDESTAPFPTEPLLATPGGVQPPSVAEASTSERIAHLEMELQATKARYDELTASLQLRVRALEACLEITLSTSTAGKKKHETKKEIRIYNANLFTNPFNNSFIIYDTAPLNDDDSDSLENTTPHFHSPFSGGTHRDGSSPRESFFPFG